MSPSRTSGPLPDRYLFYPLQYTVILGDSTLEKSSTHFHKNGHPQPVYTSKSTCAYDAAKLDQWITNVGLSQALGDTIHQQAMDGACFILNRVLSAESDVVRISTYGPESTRYSPTSSLRYIECNVQGSSKMLRPECLVRGVRGDRRPVSTSQRATSSFDRVVGLQDIRKRTSAEAVPKRSEVVSVHALIQDPIILDRRSHAGVAN